MVFRIVSDFKDRGDQSRAIRELVSNIRENRRNQVLLGVTGSGKTYTVARVIQEVQLPALVISHNKTLTAQLYSEFKSFFPENAVEYFVSYYDYYQPEAYIPHKDIYIEKDSSINERIDQLRLKATSSLMSRRDVIVVASVSCIYGIGSPGELEETLVVVNKEKKYERKDLCEDLAAIQYSRNDIEFTRGVFRVRGPVVDVYPAYTRDEAVRIRLEDDRITDIQSIDPVSGLKKGSYDRYVIYPATHFVTKKATIDRALGSIKKELEERLEELRAGRKYLEAQRLQMRTEYDMEMLRETGYCQGIENYSRHLTGRAPGRPPDCLINYFPDEFLTIIDESHVTLPQVRGMYAGDYSRKKVLVEHGFRLPSAIDNRPLKFGEFEELLDKCICVSATPGAYEMEKSGGRAAELIIRPTGLVDPLVEVRPVAGQVEDLIKEVKKRASGRQRVLVTTLTKKMAEDLSEYMERKNIRVRYLHSEIDTLERIDILKDLRKGEFDCLVGVNLLREGLDLPEVTLVAILDADKEGFLRSETSLIQVCGRVARNVEGRVIMYADRVTGSMERAMREMDRRREKQSRYNIEHNITPRTIIKAIREDQEFSGAARKEAFRYVSEAGWDPDDPESAGSIIERMEKEMKEAADMLDFELAIAIRDRISEIREKSRRKK
ncbi:MAG: excinuclease ABC subunit UvrB [Elusimicrobia bacterium]|nr:excinuclease ABC subunit UvrB [Elusimicrobiota bacterium]